VNLNSIESLQGKQSARAIIGMLKIYGTEVEVLREATYDPTDSSTSPTRDVYGKYAGTLKKDNVLQSDKLNKIRMLIAGNPFTEHSPGFDFGMPEEVPAYATYADLRVGDTVLVARTDNEKQQLEVVAKQSLGTTTSTIFKYMLSPNPIPTEDAVFLEN